MAREICCDGGGGGGTITAAEFFQIIAENPALFQNAVCAAINAGNCNLAAVPTSCPERVEIMVADPNDDTQISLWLAANAPNHPGNTLFWLDDGASSDSDPAAVFLNTCDGPVNIKDDRVSNVCRQINLMPTATGVVDSVVAVESGECVLVPVTSCKPSIDASNCRTLVAGEVPDYVVGDLAGECVQVPVGTCD